MGKRQIRISRSSITDHLVALQQQPRVQVVLRNHVVLHGHIQQLKKELLQLQDLRFNQHTLALEQVEEIIYDVEAPY